MGSTHPLLATCLVGNPRGFDLYSDAYLLECQCATVSQSLIRPLDAVEKSRAEKTCHDARNEECRGARARAGACGVLFPDGASFGGGSFAQEGSAAGDGLAPP